MELKEQQYEPQENELNIPPSYLQSDNPPTYNPNYTQINSDIKPQNQITNTNVNSGGESSANPIEIISFLSWILLISCKWNAFNKSRSYNLRKLRGEGNYRPLLYDTGFQDFITIIICSLAFIIYVVNIIYKKNLKIYQSLFGQWSKYHFVPLILYSIMVMMTESASSELYKSIEFESLSFLSNNSPFGLKGSKTNIRSLADASDAFNPKPFFAFYLIFGIFSLAALIFIYMKTEMNCDWYAILTIKKGAFSALIMEVWILIFESIFRLRYIDAANYGEDISSLTPEDMEDILNGSYPMSNLYKTGGVMFSLIIGIGAFLFGFIFKDIIILFLNFIIYLGMILCFYGNQAYGEELKKLLNGDADGIIQIIIAVIDLVLILFMILFYKEKLIQS